MFERIEVLKASRRAVRRAVLVECDVMADVWDEPVSLVATDLSPLGMWIETPYPLDIGDQVVVSFSPPNGGAADGMVAVAAVRRTYLGRRRRDQAAPPGMGLEFIHDSTENIESLERSLLGLPPPIPSRRAAARRTEVCWVDEVGEDEPKASEIVFEPISELLTGGLRARWRTRERRARAYAEELLAAYESGPAA